MPLRDNRLCAAKKQHTVHLGEVNPLFRLGDFGCPRACFLVLIRRAHVSHASYLSHYIAMATSRQSRGNNFVKAFKSVTQFWFRLRGNLFFKAKKSITRF
jgi:hypothetical protein